MFDLVKPTGAFLLFGINCVIAGVFCLLYLKEITGLTSEQAKSVYKPDHSLKSNKRADINVSIITGYEGNSFVAKNV